MFNIAEKVALVTRGASVIGLACVKEFLKHGAKGITIADINKNSATRVIDDLNNVFGNDKLIFAEVDVTHKKQFDDGFILTVEKFRNLDILVNNVGVFDEQNWEKTIAINVNGYIIGNLLGFETYISKYKNGPEGVIINMCSRNSVDAKRNTTTKFGVLGLSRSFGVKTHYERRKIKVI
ncbi:hypothetical protein FQA39_LY01770 [Lamprigera yunnana]|nr:hypothetical protein FQA39_LY01770 [Lamprigera yunnana]